MTILLFWYIFAIACAGYIGALIGMDIERKAILKTLVRRIKIHNQAERNLDVNKRWAQCTQSILTEIENGT